MASDNKCGKGSRLPGIVLRCLVVVTGLLALYYIELTTVQREYFLDRHGTLAKVNEDVAEFYDDGRTFQNVSLTSSSGLVAELRVSRPASLDSAKLPLVFIIGGQRTGKTAVDLVASPGDVVFAAIDYPYHGPSKFKGLWQSLPAIRQVQRGFIDTPPAVALGLDWLLDQPWVDPQHVNLIGISLGVPFAAVAGALDDRVGRVWLVQGGADNVAWADFALRSRIENDAVRHRVAKLALLLTYGNSFETREWMAEIAPRPIIVISARDDDFVPESSALAAAADPEISEIIWTEGQHVRPKRQEVLQELLDIVVSRVESRAKM